MGCVKIQRLYLQTAKKLLIIIKYKMTSLSGKNVAFNSHNLSGGSSYNKKNVISTEMKNLKIQLLNNYLIPIFSQQWDILYENLFFVNKMRKQIHAYHTFYKTDDFVLYLDLIDLLEVVIDKHKLLEDMEKKITGTSKEEVVSMIFKTTAIKLLPEYELYDNLIGKPKREYKEKYNEEIIGDIKDLLRKPDINYLKMKMIIENKYFTNLKIQREKTPII